MIKASQEPLTLDQLKRLTQHQYKSTGKTLLDPCIQPFWEWVVLQFPEWFAPNLMTICGLMVNVITCLLLVIVSPDAKSDVHPLYFVACAAGLFIYQTLDACDGKQARRTGSSSPLGELFDHGCDAISTIFVALGICVAVKLGGSPGVMVVQCLFAMFLFYCAHWQTYITGILRFGRFDVTEAQFFVMAIHLLTAIFGQDLWGSKFFFIELRYLPFCGCVGGAVFALTSYLLVCSSSQTMKVCEGSSLAPFIPSLLTVLPALLMAFKSPILMQQFPCLYIMTFGFVAVKLTFRLIVAHMTHTELQTWDYTLLTPIVVFLNQYLDFLIPEQYVLWLGLVYTTTDLFWYANTVCSQICVYLKIDLFRISPAIQEKKNSVEDLTDKPLLKGGAHSSLSTPSPSPEEPPRYQDVIVNKN